MIHKKKLHKKKLTKKETFFDSYDSIKETLFKYFKKLNTFHSTH